MNRRPLGRRHVEDATSQGGWLFADSFLALMVIFLATISFVPILSSSTSPDQASGTSGNYKNAFVMVFDSYDPLEITRQLQEFFVSEELPLSTQVLYAEILGGYDSATEEEYDGNLKGLAFAIRIKQDSLPGFADATVNVGATPSIKANQVLLRLTLTRM